METKAILQHVKQTYSAIAEEFNATRDREWPEFEKFLAKMKIAVKDPPWKILDIGCGNGRLVHFLAQAALRGQTAAFTYTGIDNNFAMIRIARKKFPQCRFRVANATALPFPPRSFDAVWCIAILHHLPTEQLRLQALKEMRRVLQKSGCAFLTVWNLHQPKYRAHIEKNQDAWIPWGAQKQPRYYHAFTRPELADLLQKAGFRAMESVPSAHNIAFACLP